MNKKRQQKLEGLLYKKRILEHQIKVAGIGSEKSMKYAQELKKHIETLPDGLEKNKLTFELMGVDRVASDFVSDFKEFRKLYEDGLIGDIQQTVEREQFNEMEFHYVQDRADKLAQYEIYGKTIVRPANVELPLINESIQKEIDLIKNLSEQIEQRLTYDLSPLDRARLEKELFDLNLHGQTLQKRLNKRMEYYLEQFLPAYEKDMADCEKNLDRYLDIAKKLIELNIDIQLKFMFDEYEKHKDDKEQLWLFYTALRARLHAIGKVVGRNKKKFPKVVDDLKEFF